MITFPHACGKQDVRVDNNGHQAYNSVQFNRCLGEACGCGVTTTDNVCYC
jgi:hypothetical protein